MIDLNWPVLTVFDEVTDQKKAKCEKTSIMLISSTKQIYKRHFYISRFINTIMGTDRWTDGQIDRRTDQWTYLNWFLLTLVDCDWPWLTCIDRIWWSFGHAISQIAWAAGLGLHSHYSFYMINEYWTIRPSQPTHYKLKKVESLWNSHWCFIRTQHN